MRQQRGTPGQGRLAIVHDRGHFGGDEDDAEALVRAVPEPIEHEAFFGVLDRLADNGHREMALHLHGECDLSWEQAYEVVRRWRLQRLQDQGGHGAAPLAH